MNAPRKAAQTDKGPGKRYVVSFNTTEAIYQEIHSLAKQCGLTASATVELLALYALGHAQGPPTGIAKLLSTLDSRRGRV